MNIIPNNKYTYGILCELYGRVQNIHTDIKKINNPTPQYWKMLLIGLAEIAICLLIPILIFNGILYIGASFLSAFIR